MRNSQSRKERISQLEVCYFWYHPNEPDESLRPLFREDQVLVVTCPEACPQLLRDFGRAGGIRLLYTSLYKAPLMRELEPGTGKWRGGSPGRTSAELNPFWQAVALDGHPDWIKRDHAGQPVRPFEDPNYMKGWEQTLPTAQGYRQAVERGVEAVAQDERFDGMFIDNFTALRPQGYTLRDGKGVEPVDVAKFEQAFYSLAERVRSVGESAIQREKPGAPFWMMCNGETLPRAQAMVDFMLIECFVYNWAWTTPIDDDATATRPLRQMNVLREHGGRPVVLSYFGFSGRPIVQDVRHVRRLADEHGAIVADMLTAASPAVVADFARANYKAQGSGRTAPDGRDLALVALEQQQAGDHAAAKEFYGITP